MSERKPRFETASGIPLEQVYRPGTEGKDEIGPPGEFPYTRGIQATMYRGRLWTMRQYAGFGSAAETNERFKYLLANGQTGLSVAFDLPTQMGWIRITRLRRARWGRLAWPSTHSTTWRCCSTVSRSIACRPR